jgi:hypothetical protein
MDTNATTITEASLQDSHHDCFACGVGNKGGLNLHFEIDSDGMASVV